MPIPIPIDQVLKLLGYALDLVRERDKVTQKKFDDTVKALMEPLAQVHSNYLDILQELRHRCQNGEEIATIRQYLEKRRAEQEPARRRAEGLASEFLKEKSLARYHMFFELVSAQFRAHGSHPKSYVEEMLQILKADVADDKRRADLRRKVDSVVEDCRKNWAAVSEHYGRAIIARL